MKGTTAVLAVLAVACQGGGRKEKEAPAKEAPPPVPEEMLTPPLDPPVAPAAGPERAILVAEDGYWIAEEGKEPKKVALDKAALGMELDLLQSGQKGTKLDLAAEDAVKYQEIITAMDTALAKGMTEVALVGAASLPVKLPPEGGKMPTRCNDNAPGTARPAEGPSAPIATLPVVIMMEDGSGSFAGTDGKKTEFAAPKGCEADIPALVAWLKAGNHKTIIVQADKDATAGMIHRVVRSASAAGAGDVLFAVKR